MAAIGSALSRLEGLVRDGSLVEAAARLNRASDEIPALDWVATTAGAVTRLGRDPTREAQALVGLLQSRAMTGTVRLLDRSQSRRLGEILTMRRTPAPPPPVDTWKGFAFGMHAWRASEVRRGLAVLTQAGGLGDTTIALEATFAGILAEDVTAARRNLVHYEDEAARFFGERLSLPPDQQWAAVEDHPVTKGAMALFAKSSQEAVRGGTRHRLLRQIYEGHLLTEFLQSSQLLEPILDGRRPFLLTHFLLGKDSGLGMRGACNPIVTFLSHIATRLGIPLEILLHTRHVNFRHAETGFVIEPTETPVFWSTLDEWQALGMFGMRQDPAPVEAVVAGSLLNLGHIPVQDQAQRIRQFTWAALRVYRAYPAAHANLAQLLPDSLRREHHLKMALRVHPHYAKAHELLADSLLLRGRRERARRQFEVALRVTQANREAAAPPFPKGPPYVASEADLARIERKIAALGGRSR